MCDGRWDGWDGRVGWLGASAGKDEGSHGADTLYLVRTHLMPRHAMQAPPRAAHPPPRLHRGAQAHSCAGRSRGPGVWLVMHSMHGMAVQHLVGPRVRQRQGIVRMEGLLCDVPTLPFLRIPVVPLFWRGHHHWLCCCSLKGHPQDYGLGPPCIHMHMECGGMPTTWSFQHRGAWGRHQKLVWLDKIPNLSVDNR